MAADRHQLITDTLITDHSSNGPMEGVERAMNATFADIHAAADYIGPGAS